MTQLRNVCLTINNYDESDFTNLRNWDAISYAVLGREIAPTTGTPHIQGYLEFKSPKKFTTLKKMMPRARLVPRNGTAAQAAEYCKKDDNFEEWGQISHQGKRSDIQTVRDMLNEGSNMRDVVQVSNTYQAIRMAEVHLKYFEKPRTWKPHVVWCYGPTGTGKSRYAYEQCEGHDTYTAMSTGKWFEGYDRHTHVIIDDMRRNFMMFNELLKFLDRYEYRVEFKGGSRQMLCTHIYITSCYHPADLYDTREDIGQLTRRIDEIKEFKSAEK